jgi:hypothetical protein
MLLLDDKTRINHKQHKELGANNLHLVVIVPLSEGNKFSHLLNCQDYMVFHLNLDWFNDQQLNYYNYSANKLSSPLMLSQVNSN